MDTNVSLTAVPPPCLRVVQIVQRITFVNPPSITPEWKRKVAQDAIESLSAAKLARSICSQFRTRLNSSHDAFAASLRQVSPPPCDRSVPLPVMGQSTSL